MFTKIEQAKEQFPQWVTAINGKIGDMSEKGFSLVDASIQVFEKKPNPEAAPQLAS